MRFRVADDVLALFPAPVIGILGGEVASPRPGFPERLRALQEGALARLHAAAPDVESLMAHSNVRIWRQAYQRFGAKPTKFRPTHEAFARRLLKDPAWPAINPIVDVYLTNQVAHLLPHGGYDRASLDGDLCLGRSPGGEAFAPLGGGEERTERGEVVYRDAGRVLTRRWNHRDSELTRITGETRRPLLFVEALDGIPAPAVEDALADLARRLAHCFEGTFTTRLFVASHGQQEIALK